MDHRPSEKRPTLTTPVKEETSRNSALPKTRVLVVEDDDGTRLAIANWISSEPSFDLVGEFADPRLALKKLAKLSPQVVLVDVNMPIMNGIEFVAKAREQHPESQFLMLTAYGDTDHIFQALKAGASGYLLKSTLRDDLILAIREVQAGGSPMTSDVARKVVQSFHREKSTTKPEHALSDRESAVLEKLAAGYLYKEIASELGLSISTISTFVRRIYIKLQVNSRAQAVAKVMIPK